MKNFINLKNLNVFMIGIGGISMSGLAKIVLSLGGRVSGSDISDSAMLKDLSDLGVKTFKGHSENNITSDIDLVVYSGAIHNDNVEMIRAKELGIMMMERSEFLGLIASEFSEVIAISGTHGKTTTTAMIATIFKQAKLDFTMHLGGKSVNFGTNTYIGGDKYFIVEACEYRESFRYLNPTTAVITNIEADHLDYYNSISDIERSFENFAKNSTYLIQNNSCSINHPFNTIIGSEWVAENIVFSLGGYDYDVFFEGEYFGHFRLNCLGIHNVTNSLFAIAVADHYGIRVNDIVLGLSRFMGVERRYQKIGSIGDSEIIIDYAHHPTEIDKSMSGLSQVYDNILCVFQPHTYSRTKLLFDDFVSVLSTYENLFLYSTYPAREVEIPGGSAEDLAVSLGCECFSDIDTLVDNIKLYTQKHNINCVVVLGAGDLAEKLQDYLGKFIN